MQGDDDLGQVHDKLQATKAVMSDSIEKVLERGEKIELLVDKTEHLHQHAFRFAKSSTQLKRSLRWREMKCKIIGAAVALGRMVEAMLPQPLGSMAPQLAPCASSGRAWRPRAARHSQGRGPSHWDPIHRLSCSSEPP